MGKECISPGSGTMPSPAGVGRPYPEQRACHAPFHGRPSGSRTIPARIRGVTLPEGADPAENRSDRGRGREARGG